MTDQILSSLPLENGLTLVCSDRSKKIAADRWYVCVIVQIEIPVEIKWFQNLDVNETILSRITDRLGRRVVFQQKKERNFVSDETKDRILLQIVDRAEEMGAHYFGREDFAGKFILKCYADPKLRK